MSKRIIRYSKSRFNLVLERDRLAHTLSGIENDLHNRLVEVSRLSRELTTLKLLEKYSLSKYSFKRIILQQKLMKILESLRFTSSDIRIMTERLDDFIDDVDDSYVPKLTQKSKK